MWYMLNALTRNPSKYLIVRFGFNFFFDRNLLQRNEIILIVLSKINYSQILISLQLFLEIKEKQKRRTR